MPTYLPNEIYDRLVAALLDLPAAPDTGKSDESAVMEKLGEIAGVWPASIEAEPSAQGVVA